MNWSEPKSNYIFFFFFFSPFLASNPPPSGPLVCVFSSLFLSLSCPPQRLENPCDKKYHINVCYETNGLKLKLNWISTIWKKKDVSRPSQQQPKQPQQPPPQSPVHTTTLPSAAGTVAPTPHDPTKFVTMPDEAGKKKLNVWTMKTFPLWFFFSSLKFFSRLLFSFVRYLVW